MGYRNVGCGECSCFDDSCIQLATILMLTVDSISKTVRMRPENKVEVGMSIHAVVGTGAAGYNAACRLKSMK